jgi:hypothetical protein
MCKYYLILLKFEECGYVLNQTVWNECEEATERGKKYEGDIAFNVSNELPAFNSFKKRNGVVIASLRERNNPRYKLNLFSRQSASAVAFGSEYRGI